VLTTLPGGGCAWRVCDGGRAGEAGEAKDMLRPYSATRTGLIAVLPESARCCTTCRALALTGPGALVAAPPLKVSSCERRRWLCRWAPSMPGRLCFVLPMPTTRRRAAIVEVGEIRVARKVFGGKVFDLYDSGTGAR